MLRLTNVSSEYKQHLQKFSFGILKNFPLKRGQQTMVTSLKNWYLNRKRIVLNLTHSGNYWIRDSHTKMSIKQPSLRTLPNETYWDLPTEKKQTKFGTQAGLRYESNSQSNGAYCFFHVWGKRYAQSDAKNHVFWRVSRDKVIFIQLAVLLFFKKS